MASGYKRKYKIVIFLWIDIPEYGNMDITQKDLSILETQYGLAAICNNVVIPNSVLITDKFFMKTVRTDYSGVCVVVDEVKYGLFILEHSDKISKVLNVEYEVYDC